MFSDNIPLVTVNTDATVYFSGVANIPVVPLANPGCLSDSAIFITSVMKSTDSNLVCFYFALMSFYCCFSEPKILSSSEPTMAPLSTLAVVETECIALISGGWCLLQEFLLSQPQVEKYVKALEEELRAPEVASKVEATAIEVSETTFSFMDDALKQVWDSAL
ncbi:hypothetical protein V6N11_068080 [Hibiscus sabdariffa]|uniref:Uncharacterized protein n=1 Tax=Hibiscus sabdariffa TaxID=183260 RepID=A0ABR2SSL9_9ROSI